MKLIFLITQLQQGEWTLGAMVEARAVPQGRGVGGLDQCGGNG